MATKSIKYRAILPNRVVIGNTVRNFEIYPPVYERPQNPQEIDVLIMFVTAILRKLSAIHFKWRVHCRGAFIVAGCNLVLSYPSFDIR